MLCVLFHGLFDECTYPKKIQKNYDFFSFFFNSSKIPQQTQVMLVQKILTLLLPLTAFSADCKLEGVPAGTLNGKMATIYSVRFGRGLEAIIHFNVVRHNPCPGGGGCKWIFKHCKGNEFSLESKKYRGSHLFANVGG